MRRRAGLESGISITELRHVLERTLGVPLFQEQAMKIAIVGAGFTGAEVDQLRRAMAIQKSGITHHERMVKGMMARGYDAEFATRCFKQIEGFGTYGFPESHAASFALLFMCQRGSNVIIQMCYLRAIECTAYGVLCPCSACRRGETKWC